MSQDEVDPYYQSGVAGVEHRNIDSAGEGHPFGDEPKEWEADLRPLIRQVADDLYDSWEATVREYLANAETACLKVQAYAEGEDLPYDDLYVEDGYEPRIIVEWDRAKQKLIIQDNGIGMSAAEVDQVFRHIGRSAARDLGTMSGAFGMGSLSFPKFIGTGNATMVMLSNSRLNSDNAAYLVSLAGVEPIRGSLGSDEYGTKFKLDQKRPDMDVRDAVERYAEWMRVPVLYTEYDENGTEVFNEDYGDKHLYDDYDDDKYASSFVKRGAFEAYMSPDATGRTLLLSMDIDRGSSAAVASPYPFDVRILDESGKVVRSENGHEGLVPVSRPDYNQMLLDARPDSITQPLLSNQDVVGVDVVDGPNAGATLVEQDVLDSDDPLPVGEYIADYEPEDRLGEERVIIGPHQGRTLVTEETWSELPQGRAAQFVPEDELGEDDLCLPEPTTDRSSLQSNKEFWNYIAEKFAEEYDQRVEEYRNTLRSSDDTIDTLRQMKSQTAADLKGQ